MASGDRYVIGVIADTHNRLREDIVEALEGVDLIIHAGDVCGQRVIDELELVAPTITVRGNNDHPEDFRNPLPPVLRLTRKGTSIKVVHKLRDVGQHDADIVITGHTHKPLVQQQGTALHLNPGSASLPRDPRGPSIALIELEESEDPQVRLIFPRGN